MIHTMNTINQLNDKLFYAVATQHLGVGEAKLILHEAVINDDGSVVYGAGGTVIVEPSAVVINREFKTDDTKQVDDKEWIAQLEAMLKSRTQEVKELKAKTANLPKKNNPSNQTYS